MKFLIRLVVNGVALYAAVALLNGHGLVMEDRSWVNFIWLAIIFGVVHAVIKPILKVIGCVINILTLGLGFLLINMALFYLTAWIGQQFGVGFQITSLLGAFLGSVITSAVSLVLNRILKD